jgi:hypothetical protein
VSRLRRQPTPRVDRVRDLRRSAAAYLACTARAPARPAGWVAGVTNVVTCALGWAPADRACTGGYRVCRQTPLALTGFGLPLWPRWLAHVVPVRCPAVYSGIGDCGPVLPRLRRFLGPPRNPAGRSRSPAGHCPRRRSHVQDG